MNAGILKPGLFLSLSAVVSPIRRLLRLTWRYAAVVLSIFGCLLAYLFNVLTGRTSPEQRAQALHRSSVRLLRWLGVSYSSQGTAPASGLIVSNHLSYLDILLFSAVARCVFVSKREVKFWPGIGWIATLAGCIYIDRARHHGTHDVQPQMAATLTAGVPVVLFAEGTSTDGRQVLPFRSSLFQPAVASRVPISAACLSYDIEDGDPAIDVCYYGDHVLGPHSLNLFGKGNVTASVRFADCAKIYTNRKDAARQLHEQVCALKAQSAAEVSRVATAVV